MDYCFTIRGSGGDFNHPEHSGSIPSLSFLGNNNVKSLTLLTSIRSWLYHWLDNRLSPKVPPKEIIYLN